MICGVFPNLISLVHKIANNFINISSTNSLLYPKCPFIQYVTIYFENKHYVRNELREKAAYVKVMFLGDWDSPSDMKDIQNLGDSHSPSEWRGLILVIF